MKEHLKKWTASGLKYMCEIHVRAGGDFRVRARAFRRNRVSEKRLIAVY